MDRLFGELSTDSDALSPEVIAGASAFEPTTFNGESSGLLWLSPKEFSDSAKVAIRPALNLVYVFMFVLLFVFEFETQSQRASQIWGGLS
jgi:hypothetical protein